MSQLLPPCTYQGSKRRQAPEIVTRLLAALSGSTGRFYELCAGSGAVSLELLSRGFPASRITMVDAGPWGDVWRAFGEGTFPVRTFRMLSQKARSLGEAERHAWLRELADTPTSPESRLAVFLVLQGHTFGGIAVTETDGRFKLPSLMLRAIATAYDDRVTRLIPRVRGVTGLRQDVRDVCLDDAACAFVDPPYIGTAGYGDLAVDIPALARRCPSPLFVSEGRAMPGAAQAVRIDSLRTGYLARRDAPDEWLSVYRPVSRE